MKSKLIKRSIYWITNNYLWISNKNKLKLTKTICQKNVYNILCISIFDSIELVILYLHAYYMPSKLQNKLSEVVSNVGISFSLEGQSQNKICYHKIMQAKFNTLTIYDIRHICIWWEVVLYAHLFYTTIIASRMHKCHPNICWS